MNGETIPLLLVGILFEIYGLTTLYLRRVWILGEDTYALRGRIASLISLFFIASGTGFIFLAYLVEQHTISMLEVWSIGVIWLFVAYNLYSWSLRFVNTYIKRGNQFYSEQQYDHAIRNYTMAITLFPEQTEAYMRRGSATYNKRDYRQAVNDFTEVIIRSQSVNTQLKTAYFMRSQAHGILGEFDAAVSDYRECMRLLQTNRGGEVVNLRAIAPAPVKEKLEPIYNWAKALFLQRAKYRLTHQNWEGPIADCNHALEIDPQQAKVLDTRGAGYQAKREYEKALTDYEQAIQIAPEMTVILVGIAQCYEALGQAEKVAQYYQQYREQAKAEFEDDPRVKAYLERQS